MIVPDKFIGVNGAKGVSSLSMPTALAEDLPVGDLIVVTISIRSAKAKNGLLPTVASVSDSSGNIYSLQGSVNNNQDCRSEVWTSFCTTPLTPTSTIVVTPSESATLVAMANSYSGVIRLGNTGVATGSGFNPSISLDTQDADNWVVANFAWEGTANTVLPDPAGHIEHSYVIGGGPTDSNCGACCSDNSSATPGPVENTLSMTFSSVWAAVALELRSA